MKYKCVYSNLLSKYFCRTNEYGLKCKSDFELAFKDWKSSQTPFGFIIPKTKPVQGQVKFITKTDKNKWKGTEKKKLNREEKKQGLMEELKMNDVKMARTRYNK